jgi:hypothetical protein
MPQSWSLETPTDPGKCGLIDGVYKNIGIGKIEETSPLREVGFDVALGRPMPSAKTPETVAVKVSDRNIVVFTFEGHQRTSFSQPYKCMEGWYVIEENRDHVYLGDGVSLDQSDRRIALGKSQDGSLIVHTVAVEQYSSLLVFKSKDSRESWYLFSRLGQMP